jgi:hypothetical protein
MFGLTDANAGVKKKHVIFALTDLQFLNAHAHGLHLEVAIVWNIQSSVASHAGYRSALSQDRTATATQKSFASFLQKRRPSLLGHRIAEKSAGLLARTGHFAVAQEEAGVTLA